MLSWVCLRRHSADFDLFFESVFLGAIVEPHASNRFALHALKTNVEVAAVTLFPLTMHGGGI